MKVNTYRIGMIIAVVGLVLGLIGIYVDYWEHKHARIKC